MAQPTDYVKVYIRRRWYKRILFALGVLGLSPYFLGAVLILWSVTIDRCPACERMRGLDYSKWCAHCGQRLLPD